MAFLSIRDRVVFADIRELFVVNKHAFCWLFFLYIIGIFAILRSNVLYVNDTVRLQMNGLYFKNVGRIFSEWLGNYLFLPAADVSPLTQLGAMACMAAASIFACATLYRRRMDMWQVLCCVPIGLSPYFLQNISYKFDSLFMGLAALCVTAAVYCLTHHGRSRMGQIVSALALFSTMCLYQAMINLFFTIAIFWCAGCIFNGTRWKKICMNALRMLPALAIGLLLYRGAMHFVELNAYMLKHNSVMPLHSLFTGLWHNIYLSLQFFWEDWGSNRIGLVVAGLMLVFTLCQIVAVRCLSLPLAQKILRFGVGHMLLWLGVITLPGLMLFLPEMVLEPRVFAPAGLYVALSMLFIYTYARSLLRYLAVVCCGTCILYCFVFAAAYGNALAIQDDFERMLYSQLVMDMSKYCEEYKTNKVRFAGYMPKSSQIQVVEENFPVMAKLVAVSLRNGDWHTPRKFSAMGLYVTNEPKESVQETPNVKTKPLLHRAFYDIAINSDNVLFLTFPFGRQDGKGR